MLIEMHRKEEGTDFNYISIFLGFFFFICWSLQRKRIFPLIDRCMCEFIVEINMNKMKE